MRAHSAGSFEMSLLRSCAVERGFSTSSMIFTVISGSVAMCEIAFTALVMMICVSNFAWVTASTASSDVEPAPVAAGGREGELMHDLLKNLRRTPLGRGKGRADSDNYQQLSSSSGR